MIIPEESLLNLYADECFESENTIRQTRQMRRILDAKYEKADPNKVMTEKCQHQYTEKPERLLALLRKLE